MSQLKSLQCSALVVAGLSRVLNSDIKTLLAGVLTTENCGWRSLLLFRLCLGTAECHKACVGQRSSNALCHRCMGRCILISCACLATLISDVAAVAPSSKFASPCVMYVPRQYVVCPCDVRFAAHGRCCGCAWCQNCWALFIHRSSDIV